MLDDSKLLHEFVEPMTPLSGTRCVRFTGKVTTAPDDTTSCNFHETSDGQVVHPRDGVQRWTAGGRRIYSHVQHMHRWLDVNVGSYLRTQAHWQSEVYPRRFLYAYGMRGSGRLTLLADYCCRNRVNLLVAWISQHSKDMLFSIYEKAASMEPCVLYINNATSIFSTPAHTNELIAAHSKCIDSLATNVWTVLAGSFAPKMLKVYQQGPHPIYTMLIEPYGDVVYVPCVSNISEAAHVAVDFIREITQYEDIVPRDYVHTTWGPVIDHMARAFLFHTMQEMRRFVRNIVAEHNSECAYKGEAIHMPSAKTFSDALQKVVRVENGGQYHFKLFTRNSYQAHAHQLEAWHAFANPGQQETPLLQLDSSQRVDLYPSAGRDYVPASISSPVRDPSPALPMLPQCAPTHRTTKRQRDATTSTHHAPLSTKSLPPPPAPSSVLDFFDDF